MMAEPYATSAVWDENGSVTEEALGALGVSAPLIERLRVWNGAHGAPIAIGRDHELAVGQPYSVRLAQQLLKELPGYEIRLADGSREWTVRE